MWHKPDTNTALFNLIDIRIKFQIFECFNSSKWRNKVAEVSESERKNWTDIITSDWYKYYIVAMLKKDYGITLCDKIQNFYIAKFPSSIFFFIFRLKFLGIRSSATLHFVANLIATKFYYRSQNTKATLTTKNDLFRYRNRYIK